jgi:hypothetical protein
MSINIKSIKSKMLDALLHGLSIVITFGAVLFCLFLFELVLGWLKR